MKMVYDYSSGQTERERLANMCVCDDNIPQPYCIICEGRECTCSGEGDDPHKLDANKPMWDLLPFDELEDIVRVLTFGMEKYNGTPWDNLPKVVNAKSRYFSALMRHLASWKNGKWLDSETQLPHLAHAGCCLLFLMWLDNREKE